MCSILAEKHHSRIAIQSCEWLHLRKTGLVHLCRYLYGWSCCHDWVTFSLKDMPIALSIYIYFVNEMFSKDK